MTPRLGPGFPTTHVALADMGGGGKDVGWLLEEFVWPILTSVELENTVLKCFTLYLITWDDSHGDVDYLNYASLNQFINIFSIS